MARLRRELEAARRKFRVKTLEALVEKRPEQAPKLKLVRKRAADKVALQPSRSGSPARALSSRPRSTSPGSTTIRCARRFACSSRNT